MKILNSITTKIGVMFFNNNSMDILDNLRSLSPKDGRGKIGKL